VAKESAMAISAELGPRLESFVDELVKNGRYGSKSEVIREGLRLVEEREKALAKFDASLMQAIKEADAGLGIPIDEAFDRLRRRYAK
jgi:antitoxin ParD1/3/4